MLTLDGGCNLQADCPLYTKVPAEIRNRIFVFALSVFDDYDYPYQPDKHWCRPGYRYPQRLDTRLLQTCKRVYDECRLLPVIQNEFVYYFFGGPGRGGLAFPEHYVPPKSRKIGAGARYHLLTQEQQRAVEKMHFFIQQFYLESKRFDFTQAWQLSFWARKITLTFRRTDWWSWESDERSKDRLGICPWLPGRTTCQMMQAEPLDPPLDYIRSKIGQEGRVTWGRRVASLQCLEVLEMEFEAEMKKKNQLDVVVERAKGWKFPRNDGTHLRWTGDISETKWEGFEGRVRDRIDAGGERPEDEAETESSGLVYVVAALTFRIAKS